MKTFQKLNRFPLGSITADGFLKDQLIRSKNGMGGHLYELEPEMIADPFVNKSYVKRWGDGDQSGWGAEISGNYWTGYIQMAFTLNDEELIKRATQWVDDVLKNQKEDGYLGTYYEHDAKIYEDYNAWGTFCGMRGLLAFYEATGRQDVFDAVYRCMLWFCRTWTGDKKTSYEGPSLIEIMVFCYYRTGDERLIQFCEEYEKFLCETNTAFKVSYKSFLYDKLEFNSNHTAGYGIQTRMPALLYSATGNPDYLKASERVLDTIHSIATHITGSPVSVTEYLGPVSSTAETEYCSYAFFNQTFSYMSYITGDAKYGDYMEELFYNGAQGARRKDEKSIAYLNSPNQIYATNESSSAMIDMQVYSPCYPVSCCPVNAVAVVPEFIRGMMLKDDSDNVYITAYGPCTLKYKDIEIVENTLYPFRDTVEFSINSNKNFSVFLKIPSWCKEYTVTVNGAPVAASADSNGYAEVKRYWQCGDKLIINFKAEIEVLRIDDSMASKKYPIAIRRGALVYAMHIPTLWKEYTPREDQAILPEGWHWYEGFPAYEEADVPDQHEQMGLKRYQISWNVALDENLKASDIELQELDTDGYAWESPFVKLKLKGYRAPYLCSPYPRRTFEPFCDKQTVDIEREIELVPYGCTNLRITYFPIADLDTLN